jgi:hypothetical protein
MLIVIKVAAFLLWVNFLPPLANIIWGDRFNRSIDGGRLWFDQHPIFGNHKTIRGALVSLLGGTAVAPLLGVDLPVAAAAALLAMAGDLLSSWFGFLELHHVSGTPGKLSTRDPLNGSSTRVAGLPYAAGPLADPAQPEQFPDV